MQRTRALLLHSFIPLLIISVIAAYLIEDQQIRMIVVAICNLLVWLSHRASMQVIARSALLWSKRQIDAVIAARAADR